VNIGICIKPVRSGGWNNRQFCGDGPPEQAEDDEVNAGGAAVK
jgi:hypothetical protein